VVKPQLLKDGGKIIKHINFNKELDWRTPKWAHVGLHIDGIGVKRKGTCSYLIFCQDENGHDLNGFLPWSSKMLHAFL
jgi:hypothetical protein